MPTKAQEDLHADSLGYSELMFQQYLVDAQSVSHEWRRYFDELIQDVEPSDLQQGVDGPRFRPPTLYDPSRITGTLGQNKLFSVNKILGLLRKISLFKDVPEDELIRVAEISRHQEKKNGDVLFREGDTGSQLFLVGGGQILIQREERVIASLGVGEVLGEMAILDGLPRSADAIAFGERVDLIVIEGKDLNRLMERRPRLALSVIKMLSGRLRNSTSGQDAVDQLIRAYRVRGHLCADLNPLLFMKPCSPIIMALAKRILI